MSFTHAYDPVKRREYYLRTRELVGNQKKALPVPVKALPSRKSTKPVKALPVRRAPVKKSRAQRHKELEERATRLQAKLDQLLKVLKALVEAAQKRSGVDKNTVEKYRDKKRSDPTSKYDKKTQKQKDAAAEASKKYYDKNKDQILEERVKDLSDKVKAIQERIRRLRNTGSVGARNKSNDK